jgi:peptidyl-prolyl cis-trans isomerase A (cyclophilin A)
MDMMKTYTSIALWLARLGSFVCVLLMAGIAAAQEPAPKVLFETSIGNFVVEMDPQHAPMTVENFLRYVREGHYDGIVFHRVVPDFVVQGGGFDVQGNEHSAHDPIMLETATAMSNLRGTIAMARENLPDTAQAEFFINLRDNPPLDRAPDDPGNTTGYTVFGRVIEGMEVIDAMAMVPLGGTLGPFPDASPTTPIVMQRVAIVN